MTKSRRLRAATEAGDVAAISRPVDAGAGPKRGMRRALRRFTLLHA